MVFNVFAMKKIGKAGKTNAFLAFRHSQKVEKLVKPMFFNVFHGGYIYIHIYIYIYTYIHI